MDIFEFPALALQSTSARGLITELVKHITPLGFTTFAIGTLPSRGSPFPTPFLVENWPDTWKDAYFTKEFGPRDPTLRAVNTAVGPLSVTDIRSGKAGFIASPQELEVLDFAASIGRPHGLIIPVFGRQGYRGIVAFAGPGPDPDMKTRLTLQFWGQIAHERLLGLHVSSQGTDQPQVRLTPREIAILQFARSGQRDSEIAVFLGITARTVRFHFENIRAKLAAKTRAEAISLAISQDLIGYSAHNLS